MARYSGLKRRRRKRRSDEMVRKTQVCRNCRMFTTEKVCPHCKSTNLSSSWKGVAIILDVNSEIAKQLNVSDPGKYALFVG